jgi:capsular polysaccharide transport system permease protein
LASAVAGGNLPPVSIGFRGLFKLIKTQFRVIHALALREIQSQQSNLAYGYGWVFFDAFFSFAALMFMKFAIRGFNRPGVPPVTFIVSGLIPWMLFQSTYSMPGGVINRGKNLLQLPMVTELDLVFGSALRIFITYAILFVVLATIAGFYENTGFPIFPLGVALLFITMSLLGIAFGLILMTLNRLYAPAGKFTGFFLRFMLIASGVIISLTQFPTVVWPYLLWNPLLHIEELMRIYWLPNYHTPIVSAGYVAECAAGMIVFGLLLERYARRRLPPP